MTLRCHVAPPLALVRLGVQIGEAKTVDYLKFVEESVPPLSDEF